MKTCVIFGTRAETIKVAPLLRRFRKNECVSIYTGQHYDPLMSKNFFQDLGIGTPDYHLKLTKIQNTTTDRATQTGEVILKLAKIISLTNPDTVIVQGDTNSVLAAAITSLKCGIPISHVEAGLRSYDWRMPEEHNRIAIDHLSEFLFAPTMTSKKILKQEQVHGQIFVTGNTSIDAVEDYVELAEKKSKLKLDFDEFALATIHRGENVDNKKILKSILAGLIRSKIPILFPVHPRTKKRLEEFGMFKKLKNSENIKLIPPVGYFDILFLMKKSKFIISDSGGIQEEATSPKLSKKVLVIRKTSDRPEAVKLGFSELIGTETSRIIKAINSTIKNPEIHSKKSPYGTGKSSEEIIKILHQNLD
jgi:UDP-N-acetylglucosamine 2-epimerase (non-hydrolysing)